MLASYAVQFGNQCTLINEIPHPAFTLRDQAGHSIRNRCEQFHDYVDSIVGGGRSLSLHACHISDASVRPLK